MALGDGAGPIRRMVGTACQSKTASMVPPMALRLARFRSNVFHAHHKTGRVVQLPRQPRAVIFDMDGLLIDTIPVYAAAMVQAGLDVEYPVSQEYVRSFAGLLGAELEAR